MTEPVTGSGAKHLAVEMVVVVTSILIAFSLDAWWSRRSEDRTEATHLSALETDFEKNVTRLTELVEREQRIAESSRRLLLLAAAPEVSTQPDSVNHLFGQVFNSGRFGPSMGAYEAIVSSGGLSRVRDDSLRIALADFVSLLENRYVENYADELYLGFIQTYTGRLGMTAAVVATDAVTASPGSMVPDRALLLDARFREHLALRYLAERGVGVSYQSLLTKAQEVLDLTRRARTE